MKTWQPWRIENGTLQLTEWPDHGPGRVLVETDVFEAFNGLLVTKAGFPAWRADGQPDQYQAFPGKTDWIFYGEGYRPLTMQDVLQDLFRHIDARPATHYTLRTLHPERVREVWPKNTVPHPMPNYRGQHDRTLVSHRPNVTLQIGPIHTQADADRLVPAALWCADLVAGVRVFCQPTERIQFPLPCRDSVFWSGIDGIDVLGENNEYTRDLRSHAIAAGVAFGHNWESGTQESEVAGG